MSRTISITNQDLIQQLKFSGKISEIIEGIIARKIITEAAAEAGIKNAIAELQQGADQFRLANQLHNAKDTWDWLGKRGLSLDDFEAIVQFNLLSGKLAQHLFANKIDPYFVEHQLDYTGAVIYEVVLADEAMAMELYESIQEEEIGFHEVARRYIEDVELRRKGGYRGIVYRKDLRPNISAVVFASDSQRLLKPLLGDRGFHLIFVEEIVQPKLTEELVLQIGVDLFGRWIEEKLQEVEFELGN
ncbi:peptidylprolyl isomerase [Pannus brasiliensis CCIBt3594]|uniref:peptidylprolyl isomerase n=1 Tax=Pannus brasiliensis CCIBt3594 TaxID=1427578 RepID=A0AAW9QYC3_9CHRO